MFNFHWCEAYQKALFVTGKHFGPIKFLVFQGVTFCVISPQMKQNHALLPVCQDDQNIGGGICTILMIATGKDNLPDKLILLSSVRLTKSRTIRPE